MNIAFAGSGLLSIYQLGVAAGLVEYAPDLVQNLNSASGASGGALTASALIACPDKIAELTRYCIDIGLKTRDYYTGAFNPRISVPHMIEESLDRVFPDNAHLIVGNKLYISLTRIPDKQNILVNKFSSKMDLIKVSLRSTVVP